MQKGIKTRLIIYEILKELKKSSSSYDDILSKKLKIYSLSQMDKNMIHNVVLNSMRFHLHVYKIIKIYAIKKVSEKQFILLLGAITQILYLDFKEYAVVNCTVEVAKEKSVSVYPGFINAILKKIIKNKSTLKKTLIEFTALPKWFCAEVDNWDRNKKNNFIETITKKPSLHIVFKNHELIKNFSENFTFTSPKSITLKESNLIKDLPNYEKGDWWVQDFASMLPLHLTNKIREKKVLDMCAAPGGKSFQAISLSANTTIIDVSVKRSKILEINLKRLKYKENVKILDALNLDIKVKYDYVLLDAPCSSIGTIRRNPEIFYRNNQPNLIDLIELQRKLLEKSKNLIKKDGTIIYMVCSFLKKETISQIEFFLKNNTNFKIDSFTSSDKGVKKMFDRNGYINCIPSEIKNTYYDGFFSAKLKRYV